MCRGAVPDISPLGAPEPASATDKGDVIKIIVLINDQFQAHVISEKIDELRDQEECEHGVVCRNIKTRIHAPLRYLSVFSPLHAFKSSWLLQLLTVLLVYYL